MRISDWSSDVCSSDLVAFTGGNGERVDNLVEEDGDVRGKRGHSATPFSAMKKRAERFCTSVAVGHSISVLGFQISKKSITPQKKAKLAMPASKRGNGGRLKRPLTSQGPALAPPAPRRVTL